MRAIKNFTQSVTQILMWTLIVAFVFSVAQVTRITGLLQAIDGFYSSNLWLFWVLLVVSRWIYSVGSVAVISANIDWLTKHDFFWFAPDRYHHTEEYKKDKSGVIVMIVVLPVAAFVFGEFFIRLFTLSNPPYMNE